MILHDRFHLHNFEKSVKFLKFWSDPDAGHSCLLGHGFGHIFDHLLTGKSMPTSSGIFVSQKLDVEAFLCVLRSFVHELFEFLSLKMIMH